MTGATKKNQRRSLIEQVGRVLIGFRDGKERFKFVEDDQKKVIKIRKRPSKRWIELVFFSDNLLEDC